VSEPRGTVIQNDYSSEGEQHMSTEPTSGKSRNHENLSIGSRDIWAGWRAGSLGLDTYILVLPKDGKQKRFYVYSYE